MTEFRNGRPIDDQERIPDGRYYTVKEFAEKHDVSETRVRVWISREQLEAKHWYGRIYIPEGSAVRFRWPWKRA